MGDAGTYFITDKFFTRNIFKVNANGLITGSWYPDFIRIFKLMT